MSVKDILVHVDTTPSCRARLRLAGNLTGRFGGYLIGVGTEGGGAAEERFATVLSACGVQGEWRTAVGLLVPAVTRMAGSADLVVLGQPDPDRLLVELTTPEDVILGCGRPVLVVPYEGTQEEVGGSVLVAWNGSREATRALHDALPLLARSSAVTLFSVLPEPSDDGLGSDELLHHLARHGVEAVPEVTAQRGRSTAQAVLSRVRHVGADLLVMGAYGHSPLRETIVGGTTHDIFRDMTVPTLMAH